METKNVLLAIILSTIVLVFWATFFEAPIVDPSTSENQITKNEDTGYSTQKPLKLLERIIQVSSNEKDLVLDAMCGSGTTLVASHNLDRKFIGIDSNKEACQIARKRIKERSSEIEMIEPVLLP